MMVIFIWKHIPKREYDSVQQLFEDKQKLIFHSDSYILRPLALTLHENREIIIPIFKLIPCSMIQLIIKLENIFWDTSKIVNFEICLKM